MRPPVIGLQPGSRALGNVELLGTRPLALFCSARCPGKVILATYDLAGALRDRGTTVASGFHSPMEKECLRLLLRGSQPIIICPARGIAGMRVPKEWMKGLEARRLLVISPFAAGQRRATAQLAQARNEFVAELADEVFISYASPGGKMEALARRVLEWGKPLYTIETPQNGVLLSMGARPYDELLGARPVGT